MCVCTCRNSVFVFFLTEQIRSGPPKTCRCPSTSLRYEEVLEITACWPLQSYGCSSRHPRYLMSSGWSCTRVWGPPPATSPPASSLTSWETNGCPSMSQRPFRTGSKGMVSENKLYVIIFCCDHVCPFVEVSSCAISCNFQMIFTFTDKVTSH